MSYNGPFREAPLREACESCREPAAVRCQRCGVPLCIEHAPPYGRRCTHCEADFEARLQRPCVLLVPLSCWLIVLVVGFASVAARLLHHAFCGVAMWASLGVMAAIATPFVVGATHLLYAFVARRQFMAQRAERHAVPVEWNEESWFC